jgi:hypothetical protein
MLHSFRSLESFAVANPIPVVPPVMTATFPCSFLVSAIGSFPHSPLHSWGIVFGMVSSRGYLSMAGGLGNRNGHSAPRRRRFPNPLRQEEHSLQTIFRKQRERDAAYSRAVELLTHG